MAETALEYAVAVRSLCEFTAKRGDLNTRFTPSPSAQQGIAGHSILADRRGPAYARELPLQARYRNLTVRGRADGYDPDRNRLEEFKTHRGSLERMPSNQRHLHWAQLKIYGALLCMQRSLDVLEIALVYLDIETDQETLLPQRCLAADLQLHFEAHCALFLDWALLEVRHRQRRNGGLDALKFPFGAPHPGQRQMAKAVYRAGRAGLSLMVQAPTGIGKTIGTLFPLLKAASAGRLDKVFYLVAKTSGREPVIEALSSLGMPEGQSSLRVLEMASKKSACVNPHLTCDAASCRLAKGFYDRLPAARLAAMSRSIQSQQTVRELAAQADVCPYYLTQELARWADIVVADYHYFFSSSALLHGLTVQNHWRIGLLVDEAHNLVARARAMYSAALNPAVLQAALSVASPSVKIQLHRVRRLWQAIGLIDTRDYFSLDEIPLELVTDLRRFSAAVMDEMVDGIEADERVLQLHFAALHFCRMAAAFGRHSLYDVQRVESGLRLCIRNVSPAPFLAPRFAACATTILFSATFFPEVFYRRLLGLPEAVQWINVESPFAGHQLEVRVEARISTRLRDRRRSLVPIAELIGQQHRSQPGNYLAFFSSFDYLQAVLAVFKSRFPAITVWEQVHDMGGDARDEFLSRFTAASHGIGFAVLGGVFAEGIDLPGERLIGAFIATLGLPALTAVNAEIERRMQILFESGYEYTYLYPGLQKVVQAAGRVIRTTSDRGTIVLIDDRYTRRRVRDLLPSWWQIRR